MNETDTPSLEFEKREGAKLKEKLGFTRRTGLSYPIFLDRLSRFW